jgi:hypothetical protein
MILLKPRRGRRGADGKFTPRLYSEAHAQHVVQKIRKQAVLPEHITLESCRHDGMTELGDAGLTEQQVMSLSGHATPAAARVCVKRTKQQRRVGAKMRRASIGRTE